MKDVIDLVARIFLAAIFMFESYDSLVHFQKTKETMTIYGVTWKQDFLLGATIFLLTLGALLLLIGYYANIGAILLLLYIIPVTLIVYSFWNDPKEVQHVQSIMFMKNIAIIGGLLLVLIHGAGKYSVKRLVHVLRLPK